MKAFPAYILQVAVAAALSAQDIRELEKSVTEFTLANGLDFILVERHESPVVYFHTYVKAGSVDDPGGQTGLAHLMERMAYKGTETIGSKNWADEKKALDAIEEVRDRLDAERAKGAKMDRGKMETLATQWSIAVDRADLYVQPNAFLQVLADNGAQGVGTTAGTDATESTCSLPSNRVELWFLMESQRLSRPVFRQFYKERDAMLEEYRQQVEAKPQGRLMQSLLATAFAAHAYRNPVSGWPSDLFSLRSTDAKAFFEKYYVPGNMVIAMVGDVSGAEARKLAEKYFGPLPGKPLPPPPHTLEPPQAGSKTAVLDLPSQPMAAVVYKRPDQFDKDDAVFDVIQGILAGGRNGMLYSDLVEEKRVAASVQALATYPDGKYPNLFAFTLVPSASHTVEENEKRLDAVLAQLKTRPVDAETLQRAKTLARAGLIRLMGSPNGLARVLAIYAANYGDWRKMYAGLDGLNKVTAGDVQRVASRYFVPMSRTVAYTAQAGAKQ